MSKKEVKYSGVVEQGRSFLAVPNDVTITPRLPSGVYRPDFNPMTGELRFERMEFKHDSIVDLPSAEYDRVVGELAHFLKPETRQAYADLGYMYKRSTLLYGRPGTGKTMIVNRICRDIVAINGICLWATNPMVAALAMEALDGMQPDTFIGVVFEEFDSIVEDSESALLTILDGQVQKNGVMYLATTNYIDRIPARVRRPGRFASVQEVKEPTLHARLAYLKAKLPSLRPEQLTAIAGATDNMTIDELKEVVQSHILLGNTLEAAASATRAAGAITPAEYEDFSEESTASSEWGMAALRAANDGRTRSGRNR